MRTVLSIVVVLLMLFAVNAIAFAQVPIPIGVARTLPDTTKNVTLEGVITTVDFQSPTATNSEYYFQDATGGIRLFIRGKIALPQGTLVRAKDGMVYTFDGRKNIEVQSAMVEQVRTPGMPKPRIVTISYYLANQAAIEGQYVGMVNVSFKSGTWPAANNNATLTINDGTADLAMFIDRDTDIDGSTQPTSPFEVLAVATQFRGTPQIQPSARADFLPTGGLPVELVDFRATAIGTTVELTWRTASETDNYGFAIERKGTSTDFQRIGFVAGHGTTTQIQSYRFVDSQLAPGHYYYRLKQINLDGTFTYSTVVEAMVSMPPETFELRQNHPNPFNPVTTIEFVLGRTQLARLAVYDALAREVAVLFDGQAEAGQVYSLPFDGAKYASGIYFYRLVSAERTQIRKMLLSK